MEEIKRILKKYGCEDTKVRFKKMSVAGILAILAIKDKLSLILSLMLIS
jgi:hypothetical protein